MASLPEDIQQQNKLGDRMKKQLLNSVIAKKRDLSVASRSIDLRDTDKSRYFAITEFNNCFIIRSPTVSFNGYPREAK